MKKTLLSLALVLAGLCARADEFTFNVTSDATDIQGEYVEEKPAEGNSNGTAAHYQPLTSLKLGDFSFTFTKGDANSEPAYYYGMSTNANAKCSIRLYKGGNTMTITAPAGVEISKVTFTGTGANTESPIYQGVGQNVVTYTCTTTAIRIETITITTGAGSEPDEPEAPAFAEYAKTTTVEAGTFVIVSGNKVANGVLGTSDPHSYGYLQVDAVTVKDDAVTVSKAYAYTIAPVAGGYTIQDANGKYYYMTASYNSFNCSETLPEEGGVWTIEAQADGTMKITNVAMDKYVQLDSQYGTFGCYADEKGTMPMLFKYVKDVEEAPTYPSVTTLNQLSSLADKETVTMDLDLTVAYANGSYVYVTDGANYGLIYKKGLGVEAGQVIAKGWVAKVSIYHGLIELVPEAATLATSGTATLPQPAEVEEDTASTMLVPANQNYFVVLLNVTFDEPTPAADATSETLEDGTKVDHREFTGKMGDEVVNFYQRFGVESVPAGTYDVFGFISVYDNKVQVQPTIIALAGGIAGVAADSSEAIYFSLDGVRVANPAAGRVYIRLQGGKAEKVLF